MKLVDLGHSPYRQAWSEQERLHAEVVAGGEAVLMIVEHPPVITMGRRGETLGVTNLRASGEQLIARGVEFVQTDRGGDITFHGPGQLVVYPIIKLIEFRLSVGGYVRLLQDVVIDTLLEFHLPAQTDPAGIGVWVATPIDEGGSSRAATSASLSKICAIGVRVKQGVTLHGLALNVTTDLSYYDLIIPCGIADRPVTSMQQLLASGCPDVRTVAQTLTRHFTRRLGDQLQAMRHARKR